MAIMVTKENGGISRDRPESPEIHYPYTALVTTLKVGSLLSWLWYSLTQKAGLCL